MTWLGSNAKSFRSNNDQLNIKNLEFHEYSVPLHIHYNNEDIHTYMCISLASRAMGPWKIINILFGKFVLN